MSAGSKSDQQNSIENEEEDAEFNSDDLFKSFMDIANDIESQIASSSDSIVTLTDESSGADDISLSRDSIPASEENDNYVVSDISEGFDKLASLLSSIQDVIDEKRNSLSSSIDSNEKRCSSGSLLDEIQESEGVEGEQEADEASAVDGGATGLVKSNQSETSEEKMRNDHCDAQPEEEKTKSEKPKPSALEILEFLKDAQIAYYGDEIDNEEEDDKFHILDSSICKQFAPILRHMGSANSSDVGASSTSDTSSKPVLQRDLSTASSDDCLNTDSEKDDEDPQDDQMSFEEFRQRFQSDSSTCSESNFKATYLRAGHTGETLGRDDEVYSGYLLKLGGSGLKPKNWKKRWFVLRKDNCFYYYKSSKDKIPLGIIVLSNYIVSKALDVNKKFAFKLVKGGGRSYVFCSDSEKTMMNWMQSLSQAALSSIEEANFSINEASVHNVSIPALSIKEPDCHGYLHKQGQGIKSWKQRYCVLKNGYLYYYDKMGDTTALGVAKLHGCTIEECEAGGKKCGFIAKPPKKEMRTFCFVADSETDKKRWMAKIEKSIKDAAAL